MYIYEYVCMYIRIYVYMYVCMYVCICLYMYMYTYAHSAWQQRRLAPSMSACTTLYYIILFCIILYKYITCARRVPAEQSHDQLKKKICSFDTLRTCVMVLM